MKIVTLPAQLCLITLCAAEAVLNLSWLERIHRAFCI